MNKYLPGNSYAPATSGTAILKGNGSGGFSPAVDGTDFTLIDPTTCSGTDKVSAITAAGGVTCSADQNSGGGGGSPGGTTGAIQYRDGGGAFAGAVVTGIVKGNGTSAPAAAVAGTDYLAPGGALGTPSSGTLTNATGLPIATGVSGLGSGIATFLATPSSANLRAALTDEVGTGAFYTVGGALGTPASGTATNLTGLPVGGIASIAADRLVGNVTGSAASPTAVAVPDCDAANEALQYTAGTGFGCDTIAGGGGSVDVGDGTTTVSPASEIAFGPGFVVTDAGGGAAQVGMTSVTYDQSGGDYTVLTGDATKTILVGAHSYTLPQAGSTGFGSGWGACFVNASAGDATIGTTTSTFEGAGGGSTLTLQPNTWACPSSNGTDWVTYYGLSTFGISANAPLLANGGGGVIGGTRSGNTTQVATVTGTKTADNLTKFDASGNVVDSGISSVGAGGGDVVGPASSTAGNIASFDDTTGKVIEDSGKALPSGTVVGTSDTQTLTNKTIDCASNTCTNFPGGGSGAETLVSTVTADNSSGVISFTGLTGNDYRLRCRALVLGTTSNRASVQFSIGGSFVTANYDWETIGRRIAATPAGAEVGNTADTAMFIGAAGTSSNAAAGFTIDFTFYDLAAAVTHRGMGRVTYPVITPGTVMASWVGEYTGATTAVDGLRLSAGSGNWASGTCSLYEIEQ